LVVENFNNIVVGSTWFVKPNGPQAKLLAGGAHGVTECFGGVDGDGHPDFLFGKLWRPAP
jgi:hypothetical protein